MNERDMSPEQLRMAREATLRQRLEGREPEFPVEYSNDGDSSPSRTIAHWFVSSLEGTWCHMGVEHGSYCDALTQKIAEHASSARNLALEEAAKEVESDETIDAGHAADRTADDVTSSMAAAAARIRALKTP